MSQKKAMINMEREKNDFSYRDILMVFLPIAGATVSIIYGFIFEFYFNYTLASKIVLFFIATYLCCLVFIKTHLINLGKHILTINFLCEISVATYYLFPQSAYFHIYYLVGVPLIYMLFTKQQNSSRIFYSLISISLLFLIELVGISGYTMQPLLTDDLLNFIKNANVISSVLVLSVTIFLFTNMMEKTEEQAHLNSITDHLTRLYNRRYFFSQAKLKIKQSRLVCAPLSVAFLDLDYFKTINDEYGHYIGDQVLILVANLLKDNIKEEDILARIGGEEFVILFNNTAGQHAIAKAEVIRQAILSAEIPSTSKTISISVGVSQLTKSDGSINTLLSRADAALYEAKEAGRNCVKSNFLTADSDHSVVYLKSES